MTHERCGKMGEYSESVVMRIGERMQGIDRCIASIVQALNAGGVRTVASCCGHGHIPGMISLADGRHLVVVPREPEEERDRGYQEAVDEMELFAEEGMGGPVFLDKKIESMRRSVKK